MIEQLARLDRDHLTFLGVMGTLLLMSLTILGTTLLVQIRRFRERQLELGFREEMLRRGHAPQQIERLLNPRRPTFSQTVAALADKATRSLAAASRRLAHWAPQALERCRQRLRPVWNRGVAFCRKGYTHAKRFTLQAWQEARPLVRRARTAVSRCAGLLSNGLQALSQRLAPHRP
jgi:hypothetical protein